jgi:outer membrane immunogenic protein
MVGGTIGAQIQQGYVVLGLEGDLDWANIKGNGISTPTIGRLGLAQPITLNIASNISAVGNGKGTRRRRREQLVVLRHGRRGVRQIQRQWHLDRRSAVFGTLGVLPNCSASAWRPGLAAGLGAEWGFTQN